MTHNQLKELDGQRRKYELALDELRRKHADETHRAMAERRGLNESLWTVGMCMYMHMCMCACVCTCAEAST